MRNLLVDHLHLEGVDVLILRGDEHARDSDDVQIRYLPRILLELKESVQERHCQEESLVVAFEVGEDFDHPIDHSCAQVCCNFVLLQAQ